MQKIILFYKFIPLKDPEAVRLWQLSLCKQLNLKGRIVIAEHGINASLGGDLNDLKAYIKTTKTYTAFNQGITFKWSEGKRDDFPRLSVKVKGEIVAFNASQEIQVNDKGIIDGGKRLNPKQVHALLKERGDEVVFFDGRNAYEAAVGKFKKAVVPNVRHSRDFLKELDSPKYAKLKNKPVVTYCTGGIRCEVLSMLMKNRGFQEVYQLDGGIAKYGEVYGDEGLWEGALYVFDDRITTKFSPSAKDIGICSHCGAKTSNYVNCSDKACNDLILVCENCQPIKTHCLACTAQAVL